MLNALPGHYVGTGNDGTWGRDMPQVLKSLNDVALDETQEVTAEHVNWAYRLLLDREPEFDPGSTARLYPSVKRLRQELLASPEYAAKNAHDSVFSNLTVIASLTPYGVDGRIFVNLSDCIGLGAAQGSYERDEIAFVKSRLRPGGTFIDLGSNIGLFALVAASIVGPQGHVIAVEPTPANVEAIRRSIAENAFAGNITLHDLIVGEQQRDDMQIAYHPLEEGAGNSGGSYIVRRGTPLPADLHRRDVRQDTLDSLIPSGQPVDFIKIDVEGAEGLVMQGAMRILTEQAPVILSEVHTSQLRKISGIGWQDYFKLMAGYGYRPFLLASGALVDVGTAIAEDGVYNVVFIKEPIGG